MYVGCPPVCLFAPLLLWRGCHHRVSGVFHTPTPIPLSLPLPCCSFCGMPRGWRWRSPVECLSSDIICIPLMITLPLVIVIGELFTTSSRHHMALRRGTGLGSKRMSPSDASDGDNNGNTASYRPFRCLLCRSTVPRIDHPSRIPTMPVERTTTVWRSVPYPFLLWPAASWGVELCRGRKKKKMPVFFVNVPFLFDENLSTNRKHPYPLRVRFQYYCFAHFDMTNTERGRRNYAAARVQL